MKINSIIPLRTRPNPSTAEQIQSEFAKHIIISICKRKYLCKKIEKKINAQNIFEIRIEMNKVIISDFYISPNI